MIELSPNDEESAADLVACPSIDGAARVEDQKTQAGTRYAEPCRVFVVSEHASLVIYGILIC
jgi:hypothetical protein